MGRKTKYSPEVRVVVQRLFQPRTEANLASPWVETVPSNGDLILQPTDSVP